MQDLSDTETTTALQRKISAPSQVNDNAEIGPAKALRTAIARAAEKTAGLQALVVGLEENRPDLSKIVEGLIEPHLIFSTSGPAGGIGLAIWDIQMVAAFTEQMITGRIVPTIAQNRAITVTDAAVLGEVLVQILKGFNTDISQQLPASPVVGFKKLGVLEDARAVSLLLEDMAYLEYHLALDLGEGAKKGVLRLIYPLDGGGQGAGRDLAANAWGEIWPKMVNDTQAPIVAVLYRKPMSLNEITELGVDDLIKIPMEVIANVSLEGSDYCRVASGRLGQQNGHRAVRISLVDASEAQRREAGKFQIAEASSNVAPNESTDQVDLQDGPPTHDVGQAEDLAEISEDADGLAVN